MVANIHSLSNRFDDQAAVLRGRGGTHRRRPVPCRPAAVANRFDRCFTMITDRPADVNAWIAFRVRSE
jgi:hypothetical protein